MKQASRFFSDSERELIERTIAEAESKTSAEIVTVVATASDRYDRAEDVAGVWLGLILLAVTWWYYPRPLTEPGTWGAGNWIATLELPVLLLATLAGFVLGAIIAARVGRIRRLFIPQNQMEDEVAAKAKELFFDNSIHRTEGGTGLLVYVSLFERMASVLGDQTIVDELGQETLDELCRQLIDGIAERGPADAVRGVIENAGEFVGSVLPREQNDVDELANELILINA